MKNKTKKLYPNDCINENQFLHALSFSATAGATELSCSHMDLVLFTFSYLLALRQSIQHTTESTSSNRHAVDIDQNAICSGCLGSHQYCNKNCKYN